MYWICKQISIHCGIGIFVAKDESQSKVYFSHFSDGKDHDQVYVKMSLDSILSVLPSNETIIISSDHPGYIVYKPMSQQFIFAESIFINLKINLSSKETFFIFYKNLPGQLL